MPVGNQNRTSERTIIQESADFGFPPVNTPAVSVAAKTAAAKIRAKFGDDAIYE
jgi:hypothetical protein